jgi:hypothetical protein
MDFTEMGVTMPGEMNLETILQNLQPVLLDEPYVFCSLPNKQYGTLPSLSPLAAIQEPEGLTLVLQTEDAKREALHFHGEFRCIRLEVHSSLESVGLTAAISTALAHEGISANLLAGSHHDHVLVPAQRALDAMEVIQSISQNED